MGQKILNLEPESDGSASLKSFLQTARATRSLMTVGKICDSGMTVEFHGTNAIVRAQDNSEVCVFERKPGGLYLYKITEAVFVSQAGLGCRRQVSVRSPIRPLPGRPVLGRCCAQVQFGS